MNTIIVATLTFLAFTVPAVIVILMFHKSMQESFDRMESTAAKRFENFEKALSKLTGDN